MVGRSQRWLASIMSWRSGPSTSRTAATRSASSRMSGLPTLIFTACVPGGDPALGLRHQFVQGVVQVHAGAVDLGGVLPLAEEAGDRGAGLARLQVPQGKVDARPSRWWSVPPPPASCSRFHSASHTISGLAGKPGDERCDVVVQQGLDRLRTNGGGPGETVPRAAVVRVDAR